MSHKSERNIVVQYLLGVLGWVIVIFVGWLGWTYYASRVEHENASKPKPSETYDRHDDLLRRQMSNDRTNHVPGSVGR